MCEWVEVAEEIARLKGELEKVTEKLDMLRFEVCVCDPDIGYRCKYCDIAEREGS